MKETQLQRLAEQLERHVRELGEQERGGTPQRMSEELIADAMHCLTAIQLQGQSENDYCQQFPERYGRLEKFFCTPEELLERRMERAALNGEGRRMGKNKKGQNSSLHQFLTRNEL